MKKIITQSAFFLSCILASNPALAWTFSLDFGANDNEVELNYLVGDEALITDGYSFFLDYSGALISSFTESPYSGLSNMFSPATDDGQTFSVGAMAFSPITMSSDTTLLTLSFDRTVAENSEFSIDWAFDNASFRLYPYVDGQQTTATGDSFLALQDSDSNPFENSTSAVPVPAAAWLLGSGLVGLVGLRRRRD